jgi:hypothetical protein
MHLFYEEYGLKRQGSLSSNSVWHITIHNVRNGKRKLGICQCPEENYVFEVDFDYFLLINRKFASDYSDDRLLIFVRLTITSGQYERGFRGETTFYMGGPGSEVMHSNEY